MTMQARRRRRGHRRRSPPAGRPDRHRRPGPLLPRRPDRHGDPRRGRRSARPFLDPAPQRNPAHGRPRAGHRRANAVTVEVRRMGGGFGGKETQATCSPPWPRLAAKKTGRAAKIRPDRDDDMVITGKRHDFDVDYNVGFDDDGRIRASTSCSPPAAASRPTSPAPVTDRALFHCRQRLFLSQAVQRNPCRCKTNTVSNTAFRGFGGPQGMIAAERGIEEIAYAVGKDPLEIRKAEFLRRSRPRRDALPPDGGRQHRPRADRRPEAALATTKPAAPPSASYNAKSRILQARASP